MAASVADARASAWTVGPSPQGYCSFDTQRQARHQPRDALGGRIEGAETHEEVGSPLFYCRCGHHGGSARTWEA